ncbi:MAG: SDR family NAD(P)-dependent oxidoreductase [Candidatus Binatus sp.]|uniref:SDR family NAD(P)-dependent oxidoreductase n=1 Tax=Candidatus Binatus sp. TaxID=2811406 RepID=UPI00271825E8|nr:SDR family NAD(P)-dependent oxidoreductase [Candidatus Binatus sp.]MDO8433114.1 SDR family NAD(P)-dependent oxidoreductase [Candidatus Binatus sp.]
MGKLQGKVAIVTGASRGIGKAISELFAKEGAKVICSARTLKEGEHPLEGSLETTVAGIRKSGGEATAVTCDVSSEADCERLVVETHRIYGPVDVLVNNAALTYFIEVKDFPPKRWMRSFAVNVHGPFMMSHLVLQDMIARKSGAIVNISSGSAIGPGRGPYKEAMPVRGTACYGAEKAALERFTQGLAEEVYADGISVTCVSPSLVVPTPGTVHHHLVTSMDDPSGEPVEWMAQSALLLATEPLDKVTGLVTYSQPLLMQYGLIDKAVGIGVDIKGSGYSQI